MRYISGLKYVYGTDSINVTFEDNTTFNLKNNELSLKRIDKILDKQTDYMIKDLEDENKELEESLLYDVDVDHLLESICKSNMVGNVLLGYGSVVGLSSFLFTEPVNKFVGGSALFLLLVGADMKVQHYIDRHSTKKEIKNNKKEIEKLNYLKDNKDTLRSYCNYSNSLEGLDDRKKDIINNTVLPFTSLDRDNYSLDELKLINSNIRFERQDSVKIKKLS